MAGFLTMWKVSGITTDFAKQSHPFHDLGKCISLGSSGKYNGRPSDHEFVIQGMRLGYEVLKEYFFLGSKQNHDNAVKFLVMFAAFSMGRDGYNWNWEHVRHVSQGLYGSMDQARDSFRRENMPLFEKTLRDLDDFLS
jgi:hypothetical protein